MHNLKLREAEVLLENFLIENFKTINKSVIFDYIDQYSGLFNETDLIGKLNQHDNHLKWFKDYKEKRNYT